MELFVIPVEDKFVLYRPLLRLAFVGNRAMADVAIRLANSDEPSDSGMPPNISTFLASIGFLKPDPSPPDDAPFLFRPTTAVLLLTNRCNLQCIYCYARGGEKTAHDLPLPLIRTVIDQIFQNSVESGVSHFDVMFHGGGEPVLAWQQLSEATAHARRKPMPCRVSMTSNGVWDKRQQDWLVDNLDTISISFDGRQETQNRQRRFSGKDGSFAIVMENIKALDARDFKYGIRLTAMAPWQNSLPQDVRFICEETGARFIQIEPCFGQGRGSHATPTQDQAEAFIEGFMAAFEIAERAGRRLSYSGARPWLLTQAFCRAPYEALVVNPYGDLVTCYEICDDTHPFIEMSRIGHVQNEQIIVNDLARQSFWAHLLERRSQCRECFCRWHCAGDCYVHAPIVGLRDSSPISTRCSINRQITLGMLLWCIMKCGGVWRGHLDGYNEETFYKEEINE